MNQVITKMIMHNKQQINFILIIFFLLVTFIFLIKQESETNRCVDCSDYSKKTYSGFVVNPDDNLDEPFYKYYSAETYQNNNIQISDVNFTLNQSTLKFSIHYFFDNFYNLSLIFLPKTKILKILQKKNICHKSSDDMPATHVCC